MHKSTASAVWNGTLKEGNGTMKIGSQGSDLPFTFASRFQGDKGATPEELIGAALAGCFSMALSAGLGNAGVTPTSIKTSATVALNQVEGGFAITDIDLVTEGKVDGIDAAKFNEFAEQTKKGCPVSKVLAAANITLKATLL